MRFLIRDDELFFFTFGITIEEIGTKGLAVAVDKAYLDLSRTVEYRLSSNYLNDKSADKNNAKGKKEFIKLKERFISDVKAVLIEEITNSEKFDSSSVSIPVSMSGAEMTAFDKWHYHLFCRIKDKVRYYEKMRLFKAGKSLECGQIQKWINMTLKYLRIMDICVFDDYDLHVPLDDYILQAMRIKGPICRLYEVSGLGISVPYDLKWSRIPDYSEYYNYQIEIRTRLKDSLDPIEWESRAWVAESVRRSK